MAIKLSANYSKKLGLPAYSSHSFSASVEVELTDLTQVEAECSKLYALLQHSVDQEIQHVGFVPDAASYGANGHRNGNGRSHSNANGNAPHSNRPAPRHADSWNCTEGQRGFILRIINENNLDKQQTEDLALQLFGLGVKSLNKMQASQLIEELLAKAGRPAGRSRWTQPAAPATT